MVVHFSLWFLRDIFLGWRLLERDSDKENIEELEREREYWFSLGG